MSHSYQHLFFDLDHTLWDFETNSREALEEIYRDWELEFSLHTAFPLFLEKYEGINEQLWEEYRAGTITKEYLRTERFYRSLALWGKPDLPLARRLDAAYLERAPFKKNLMRGARELLEYLAGNYNLHILTNGFAETQQHKLRQTELHIYFDQVITSDKIQAHKPAAKAFVEALNQAGALRRNSLMIGDNWYADILGARDAGLDQAYYNVARSPISGRFRPTLEIAELLDLREYL